MRTFNSAFAAYITFDGDFNKYFSFESGIGYSVRGVKEIDAPVPGATTKLGFGYLVLPIHFKAGYPVLPFLPLFKAYAFAGPNIGILLTSNTRGDSTIQYNTPDFGIDFGAGAEFNCKIMKPFFEVTYYAGLVNILLNPAANTSARNQGCEIKGGIRFPL